MSEIEILKKEIDKITERNRRVEKDKAWETSWSRRLAIAITTYVLISIFLIIIKVERPLISAVIPSAAYLLSTASLNIIKNWWIKRNNQLVS